jgi:predicted RND superfamily exporter protein
VTFWSGKGLKTAMVPDNAINVWFLETDPLLKSYHEFHDIFGNDEVILMLLKDDKGIFQKDFLEKLEKFINDVEGIDGVRQVHSILSAQDAFETDEGIDFHKIITLPIDPNDEKLKGLHSRMLDNPLIRDRLVDEGGQQTMLWIQMDVMEDIDVKRDQIIGEVEELATNRFSESEMPMGGVGVIYSALNLATQQDFGMFLGLSYLILLVVMLVIFRNLAYVIAAMGVISVSCIFALGLYGIQGHQINMFTAILPTLIIVIGIADALHFPSTFQRFQFEHPEKSKKEIALMALPLIFIPCFMTLVTDMAGFLSLLTSEMAVMRHLGVYSTLGLTMAFLASVNFMLIAFFLFGKKKVKGKTGGTEFKIITKILTAVRYQLENRLGVWKVASVLIFTVAAIGSFLVTTDTYTIKYLDDNHPVQRMHEDIEKNWGPYTVLEYIVKPKEGTLNEAALLNAMDDFVRRVEADPDIRNGFGLHQLYHRLAKIMGKEIQPGEKMAPDLVSQLKLVLDSHYLDWNEDSPEYKDNFLAPLSDRDGTVGRVTFVSKMMSAADIDKLLHRIEIIAGETLGKEAEVVRSGYMPLYVKIIDYVMDSQISSFFTAILLIFLLMLVWLRSWRLALISLVPNVFPIVFMLGVMGYFDINLDIATASVAAIMLGIAIDDTIHFLHYWKHNEEKGYSWSECVRVTYGEAGIPAMVTGILLILSFPVLMLANVKTVFYFGLLTTVGSVAALFGDLFMLPIMLKIFPPKHRGRRL